MNSALFLPAPAPQPLTTDQVLASLPAILTQKSRGDYLALCRLQKSGIQMVWENPYGLAPQQVVDGMGTTAAMIFASHAALTDLIVSLASLQTAELRKTNPNAAAVEPYITLPTHAWTVNENGSITVLETPYSG